MRALWTRLAERLCVDDILGRRLVQLNMRLDEIV
jgi:hypothetical protein